MKTNQILFHGMLSNLNIHSWFISMKKKNGVKYLNGCDYLQKTKRDSENVSGSKDCKKGFTFVY